MSSYLMTSLFYYFSTKRRTCRKNIFFGTSGNSDGDFSESGRDEFNSSENRDENKLPGP